MVVTNNGPDTATGVTIADPMAADNTFRVATGDTGSYTGSAILHCSLGTIPAGGSVTITLVTTPTAAGTVTNTVTVAGNETETNYANNTATASVEVNQVTPLPGSCVGRKTRLMEPDPHPDRQEGLQHRAGQRDQRLHATGDWLSG